YLAKLFLLDDQGDTLKGKIIENNIKSPVPVVAPFDEDPLTFAWGEDFYLGMEVSRPEKLAQIGFQARNDDNHIRPGDTYHLYYWEKDWLSLGSKLATDTVIYYNQLPKNALFLLKNKTRGTEEHVFIINEHKQQIWIGSDNRLSR